MGDSDGDRLSRLEAKLDRLLAGAPRTAVTVGRLFEEFEKAHSRDHSWKICKNRLLPLVRRLGALPASDLTAVAWAEHRAFRASEKNRFDRFPKPHTLTIEFFRAKELLKFGVEMGLLESSPLVNVKPDRTMSRRETWLDEAGVQQLLGGIDTLPGERQRLFMRAFVLLCLDGMMRANEARTLRRDRIHDGVAQLSAKTTKNRKERFVGLTPRALRAIAEIPPVLGDPRIFLNAERGELYSDATFREWFNVVRYASGINALAVPGERVVIHTLRHSGASAADARGASALAIKDALGHANLSTTEKYLHRHRQAGARELAKLMHEGAERERRGPKRASPPAGSRATRVTRR